MQQTSLLYQAWLKNDTTFFSGISQIKHNQHWKKNVWTGNILKLLKATELQHVEERWIQKILDDTVKKENNQEQKYICCAWRLLRYWVK
jgi:hypothetical protein